MLNRHLLISLVFSCFFSATAAAQGFFSSGGEDFLDVEDAYQVIPALEKQDNHYQLRLEWQIADNYYLYQHQFKAVARNADSGYQLALSFQPGENKFDPFFNKELTVYYDSTEVSGRFPLLEPPFEVVLTSQGCADAGLCYQPYQHYFMVNEDSILLPADGARFPDATITELETSDGATPTATQADSGETPLSLVRILGTMLGAMLGGLILNLMPCVFPVLSLKALSFASSHESKHKQHLHGWSYTAGAVVSFLVFALVMLVARQTGELLGWGFQLQQPVFVAFMVYLFFFMALLLSGFVQLGGRWMGLGQRLTAGHGLGSSFFTGVLAAVVASPCSAPFMATALGVALTQPAPVALLIFAALGVGMALPFLLLSYFPSLAAKLPAPGPWMETLKQFFAFPLFATGIWLLWVLGHQVNSDAAAFLVLGALLIAFSFWLFRFQPEGGLRWINRTLAWVSLALALAIAVFTRSFAEPDKYEWQEYSPAALAELRKEGTPVFIDLTADWCITCKLNESVALNTSAVRERADELGIVMMQGDWTNGDPDITALLDSFGRNGVPLYLMYPARANAAPEVLPQILTKQKVLAAMDNAVQ